MPKKDLEPEEGTAQAQKHLDELCASHGLKPWDLNAGSGKARWKDLVRAVCGMPVVPHKKKGRPKSQPKDDKKIFWEIILRKSQISTKVPLKTLLYAFAVDSGYTEGEIRAARARAMKLIDAEVEELLKNHDPDFPSDK